MSKSRYRRRVEAGIFLVYMLCLLIPGGTEAAWAENSQENTAVFYVS